MIAQRLVEAYEDEFNAVIDYTAYWYNGNSPVFEEIIKDECRHAKLLAGRIIELGSLLPCYWPKAKDTPSRDQRENYEDAFKDEIEAVKLYTELALMSKSVDPRTYDLIIPILEDEKRHRDIFQRFLK